MREIKTHHINECNEAIKLRTTSEVGPGGAPHRYEMELPDTSTCGIDFQNGPIKEVGTNGLTHEVLLAILEDRLIGFQNGPYAHPANATALLHVQHAQAALKSRTVERVARGVEGTHKV